MLDFTKLNLQLFGEGGDGGDSAGEAEASNISGDDIPARIPERAKKRYMNAVKANSQTQSAEVIPTDDTEEAQPVAKPTYADLIKSDEYREEHQAYMDKTIGERLKRYKGIEESNKKMSDALGIVANKYGLDASSEDFIDRLSEKINADESYYEDYAMEHNISTADAKEILTLRKQVEQNKASQQAAQRQAAMQQQLAILRQSAERTKQVYPEFDLDVEMQNERFRTLCAATQGDTLAAYRATHHDEILRAQGMAASKAATQQIANTVAANKARPIENGMSSQASSIVQTDWSKASLADIRKYAEEQRRIKR